MINKIPVTILTGYLGSGKTTILNYILKENHGKKIAVIENEFGEKNIDSEFVIHQKENIYQMTNGCICCNVRDDLVKTLQDIIKLNYNFESIIIETTGVADPNPILHTFKQIAFLGEHFEIDSIICVIDSKNIQRQIERSIEVKKQISSSNLYVLSKADLASNEEIIWAQNKIMSLNPSAETHLSSNANFDIDKIFMRGLFRTKIAVPAFFKKPRSAMPIFTKIQNADHEEGVESMSLELAGKMDEMLLNLWLNILFERASDEIYRMKGILFLDDNLQKTFLQCVHDFVELVPSDDITDQDLKINQIVIIGKNLNREMIEIGFKSCIK
ncbi:MAG: GTP-binding protein [Bacteriovoracaceae bacterium]|nr:GTP-binding protein [Bacteriovoracaceae bacterium]